MTESKGDDVVSDTSFLRNWGLLTVLIFGATSFAVALVWLAGDDGDSPDPAPNAGAISEDVERCERPDAWDRTPIVTYQESADRGKTTVGVVEFANTSDEDIRLWWKESAFTGAAEVSVNWKGGAILHPGQTRQVRVTHAVLNTGVETWIMPYRAYALSAEGECFVLGEAFAPQGDAGEDLDLLFGPEELEPASG